MTREVLRADVAVRAQQEFERARKDSLATIDRLLGEWLYTEGVLAKSGYMDTHDPARSPIFEGIHRAFLNFVDDIVARVLAAGQEKARGAWGTNLPREAADMDDIRRDVESFLWNNVIQRQHSYLYEWIDKTNVLDEAEGTKLLLALARDTRSASPGIINAVAMMYLAAIRHHEHDMSSGTISAVQVVEAAQKDVHHALRD